MNHGTLQTFRQRFPETEFWVDSMVVEHIQHGLDNGMLGVTTSPTVTTDCILAEMPLWKEMIEQKRSMMPYANQHALLWETMYDLAAERAKLLLPIFRHDTGIQGRFCIQANVYDYMNAEKMIAQSFRIRALGQNMMIKIPTTAAGICAMEEVVYSGQSVMATATSTVSQVMAAGAALYRGLERREKEGLSTAGIAVACAMQLGLPEMCYKNYAVEQRISIDKETLDYSAVAVAKKAYHLLSVRFPLVTFVLSNFETNLHWKEFLGGRLMLTMSIDWLNRLDNWPSSTAENIIDEPINSKSIETLREKIPFYRSAFDEDALPLDAFQQYEGFCRTVNLFMDIYETGVNTIRNFMLPDPYKGIHQTKY